MAQGLMSSTKCYFVGANKWSRYMDEVISRSGQFKPEDDQPLSKTSSHQRQQICDNVVKVKLGLLNLVSIFHIF